MHFDLNVIYIIVQVIFLEGILSIDNAAVLGAMVSVLPKQDMVPWPGPLKSLGPPVHQLLGGQRSAALKVGLLGAYAGRGLMLILANFVIHNPISRSWVQPISSDSPLRIWVNQKRVRRTRSKPRGWRVKVSGAWLSLWS